MTRYQEGKLNDRYGRPSGLPDRPLSALEQERAGQPQLEPEGVLFTCRTDGCLKSGSTVEVPAGWARIGVTCIVCGLSMDEGAGNGPVEIL